jgi:hypothetical protein
MPIEYSPVTLRSGKVVGGGSAVSLFHYAGDEGPSFDTHIFHAGVVSNPVVDVFVRATDAVTMSPLHGWTMPFDGVLRWISVDVLQKNNPEAAGVEIYNSGTLIQSIDLFNITPSFVTLPNLFNAGDNISIKVVGFPTAVADPIFCLAVAWRR